MYFEYFQEFRYTMNYNSETKKMKFKLKNGSNEFKIGQEDFKIRIQLNVLDDNSKYEVLPKNIEPRDLLKKLGYDYSLGNTKNKNIIWKQCFSATWRMFLTHIILSLCGAWGGHNQLNHLRLTIAHSLVNGITLDIRKMLFEDLVSKVNKKGRTHDSYIFKDVLKEDYDDNTLPLFQGSFILTLKKMRSH